MTRALKNVACLVALGTVACASAASQPVTRIIRVAASPATVSPTFTPTPTVKVEKPAVVLLPAQRPRLIARSDDSDVEALIVATFGREGAKAVRVAACESGMNPRAVSKSGRFLGLFQVDRHTWKADGSLLDAEVNVRLAKQIRDSQGWRAWPRCGRR